MAKFRNSEERKEYYTSVSSQKGSSLDWMCFLFAFKGFAKGVGVEILFQFWMGDLLSVYKQTSL